ncbi:hypothetical protein L6278_01440 [Candidatus Parcubacteria bacterium]|nr:hypothetical protein [Patescibacteria group bacterium]MBU4481847.1 hypothetical protein [Patescibacteria group bacterium]MCG2686784.1 hypothetical protein [Candidatus Parcubacteria bacterium]
MKTKLKPEQTDCSVNYDMSNQKQKPLIFIFFTKNIIDKGFLYYLKFSENFLKNQKAAGFLI